MLWVLQCFGLLLNFLDFGTDGLDLAAEAGALLANAVEGIENAKSESAFLLRSFLHKEAQLFTGAGFGAVFKQLEEGL